MKRKIDLAAVEDRFHPDTVSLQNGTFIVEAYNLFGRTILLKFKDEANINWMGEALIPGAPQAFRDAHLDSELKLPLGGAKWLAVAGSYSKKPREGAVFELCPAISASEFFLTTMLPTFFEPDTATLTEFGRIHGARKSWVTKMPAQNSTIYTWLLPLGVNTAWLQRAMAKLELVIEEESEEYFAESEQYRKEILAEFQTFMKQTGYMLNFKDAQIHGQFFSRDGELKTLLSYDELGLKQTQKILATIRATTIAAQESPVAYSDLLN